MAKEYGYRRSSPARAASSHQLLLVMLAFVLGYLTASFFDVKTISHWLNTQVLSPNEMQKVPKTPKVQHVAALPKPKFEFYTLLTNEKVPNQTHAQSQTPNQAIPAASLPPAQGMTNATLKPNLPTVQPIKGMGVKNETKPVAKNIYLVQVASFKTRNDAEQMKGTLILKGFNVFVMPIHHASKGDWYRVVVGPYPNRMSAQQAQVALAKNEHLHGMVTAGV